MITNEYGLDFHLAASEVGCDVMIDPSHPYLADHIVRGASVLPAVACLEIVLESVRKRHPLFTVLGFEDCVWRRPLLATLGPLCFQVILRDQKDCLRFEIVIEAIVYVTGSVLRKLPGSDVWPDYKSVREEVRNCSSQRYYRLESYDAFANMGIRYGKYFQRIKYVDVYKNMSVALVCGDENDKITFVNLMDSAFQSGMAISIDAERESLMPFSLGLLKINAELATESNTDFFVVTEKLSQYRTSLEIYNNEDKPLISVLDLGVKPSLL